MAAVSKAQAAKNERAAALEKKSRLRADVLSVVSIAIGLFFVFAFYTSAAGKLGGFFKFIFFGTFGPITYIFPVLLIFCGAVVLLGKSAILRPRNVIWFAVLLVMIMLIVSAFYVGSAKDPLLGMSFVKLFKAGAAVKSGGIIGMYLGWCIVKLLGIPGLFIFSITGILVCLIILLGLPISTYIKSLGDSAAEKRLTRRERKAEERALELQYEEELEREHQANLGLNIDFGDESGSYIGKKNILDSVEHDEEHITGSDASGANAAEEGFGLSGVGASGFGLEPQRAVDPGTGLGDGYEHIFSNGVGPASSAGTGGDNFANSAYPHDNSATDPALDAGPMTPFTVDDIISPAKTPVPRKTAPKPISHNYSDESEADILAHYVLPPIDLLVRGKNNTRTESEASLTKRARLLEETLSDFRVDAKVTKVTVGPTVTRYEVEPDTGIKISSIKTLEPDLALRLQVKSVRVVAMPGQAVVAIEAYNNNTTLVTLRDIIDSPEFRSMDSKISIVLGKDISGKRVITDLFEMPHLLIAGTTGSGKSVCINSILLSILYRARPDEVKFILVDPKVVELKSYNDSPHLLVPVVTEPERAAVALGYAVSIMEERYRKFAEYGVRDLKGFNARMLKERMNDEVLPQIVIVIDELSDLMLIAPAKVQEYINRLAAKSRAAGMHLIVATQQPLASILTSVIKANIPSRIAFSVASNSASRVILDEPGAERLHGKGDMLFKSVKEREPMRVQGSFVSDSEVHKVTDFVKKQMDPHYSPDILEIVSANGAQIGMMDDDEDEFYHDSVELTIKAKQASVSSIQRRFRIGYNRAARIVDDMEARGIVAASDGTNKPRRLIMTEAQIAEFLGHDNVEEDDTFLEDNDDIPFEPGTFDDE
jgi:S-DNA-T family DNA segregation ATPase FtsK/SpoIIIE